VGRQRYVVVALGCMTHQQALCFLQIFQRSDDVGIRVNSCACKEFFRQNACLLLLLEEADYVSLDLLLTAVCPSFHPSD
jgi:hypothetical protein